MRNKFKLYSTKNNGVRGYFEKEAIIFQKGKSFT